MLLPHHTDLHWHLFLLLTQFFLLGESDPRILLSMPSVDFKVIPSLAQKKYLVELVLYKPDP